MPRSSNNPEPKPPKLVEAVPDDIDIQVDEALVAKLIAEDRAILDWEARIREWEQFYAQRIAKDEARAATLTEAIGELSRQITSMMQRRLGLQNSRAKILQRGNKTNEATQIRRIKMQIVQRKRTIRMREAQRLAAKFRVEALKKMKAYYPL